jgi:hypothetical protein
LPYGCDHTCDVFQFFPIFPRLPFHGAIRQKFFIGMIGVVFCVKQIFYVIEHDSKIVLRKRFVCREYPVDSQQRDEQQVFYLHFGIS